MEIIWTDLKRERRRRQIPRGIAALLLIGCWASAGEDRSAWFREARFGMFVHWGLYSELAGSYGEHTLPAPELPNGKSWYAEWAQMRLEVPREAYQALADTFNPVAFDADTWAREARLAGMRYLVLTAKHHDGFALWDSAVSEFDLGRTPCKRDLLGELAEACRRQGLRLGFYYSHWQDWEHPGGAQPPWPDKIQPGDAAFEAYWQGKCLPQVRELLERYQPDLLWFDTWGNHAADHITPARREELIGVVRALRPTCLINGRIAHHDPGPNVDYLSAGDIQHPEKNLGRPWQTPATMRHSWGWHARDFEWKSSGRMIRLLATNASLGGNYLLNIGPFADGRFPPPAVRRLREIGGWLAVHGEAIYGAEPLDHIPAPPWGRLTARTGPDRARIVYALITDWPDGPVILPGELGAIRRATVLETGQPVTLTEDGRGFLKPTTELHPDLPVIRLVMLD